MLPKIGLRQSGLCLSGHFSLNDDGKLDMQALCRTSTLLVLLTRSIIGSLCTVMRWKFAEGDGVHVRWRRLGFAYVPNSG